MHVINKKRLSFALDANSYTSLFVPRGDKDVNVTLNSLIDIFTILLIFLLKSYSSTGFTMPLTPGIKIPSAHFHTDPVPSAMITVSNDYISVDGRRVVFVKNIRQDSFLIVELEQTLKSIKSDILRTGELNKAITFTGHILLEGDREIPFNLLQKIIFTSGQVGFDKVNLAVLKEK